jgi:hypothetical protein
MSNPIRRYAAEMKRPILINKKRIKQEIARCRALLVQYRRGEIARTLRDIEQDLLRMMKKS